MDDYYQTTGSMRGYYSQAQGVPLVPQEGYAGGTQTSATVSAKYMGSFSETEEPAHSSIPGQESAKPKRRSSGSGNTKHRRTRSGCFTCRQRRVKCDESHPICERCRKGKRECTYPESVPSVKSARGSSKNKNLPEAESDTSDGESDLAEDDRLPPILDDEDDELDAPGLDASNTTSNTLYQQRSSSSASGKSPMTPTDGTLDVNRRVRQPHTQRQQPRQTIKAAIQSNNWLHLSKEVRFYLDYHRDELSHHHYAMKSDEGTFLKSTFLEIALSYEPLLYAIVAFSAYHHTLKQPNGKIQHFLGFYNKSVSLLRKSLSKTPCKHTVATLLTILQLATFEEFLGDWVNLLGHQKAAYEIVTELFTPHTIMQSETHRKIISWYIRFDIFAGLMAGHATVLGREWFVASKDFYARQARDRPHDLGALYEEKFAISRLNATDIALLFGRKAKGTLRDDEFARELRIMSNRLAQTDHELTTAFADRRQYVTEFPNAPDTDPDDVVEATDPAFVLAGELFGWNFILIDFWSIYLMFKSQVAQVDRTQDPREIVALAFKICKMFQALQYASSTETGVVLGTQASLGIAAICLPRDQRHIMWCRRKYAMIEAQGYIYPAALRKRMCDVWNVDVTRWWLPNDEGYPPIIHAIRQFIDYRARAPHDTASEDLRDMKGLFNALSLDDASDAKSRGTGTDSDHPEWGPDGATLYESSPDINWT